MFKGFVTAVLLLSLGLSLAGCGKGGGSPTTSATSKSTVAVPPTTSGGFISTGPAVAVATASISSGGGTVKVNEPGSPLAGLEVKIPAGSYSDARQVKISYSPIEKQSFGADINPLTPLINLDNGGGYSNEWMQVRIPVKVPAGQFAMGFSYDSKRGKLRGLPAVKRDAESITLATQYLTPVVVSSINELLLNESIPSTFKPGVDDWQFTNYGSYIEPGGHCAGQTIAALWYFLNKPDGAGVHLYGTYDNNGTKPATPDFWQDDSLGYRFASMIQNDINWNAVSSKMYGDLFSGKGDIWGSTDADTMKTIAYNMIESNGEPQEVAVYSLAGEGHALIVYGMDKDGLSVADPNYPGDTTRRIKFSNGKFQPYNSGANADAIAKGRGTAFEIIKYVPQDSFVDQAKMQKRWAELKSKTIGNDVFPPFTVVWIDDAGQKHELTDGYVSPGNLIKIEIKSTIPRGGAWAFRDGKSISPNSNGKYELTPGNNKLGIYVVGEVNGEYKFLDFKYINVVYRAPSTTASPSVTAVAWNLVETKVEPSTTQTLPSGTWSLRKDMVAEANSAANGSWKREIALSWGSMPSVVYAGQQFGVTIRGSGTVVNRTAVIGNQLEAKFDPGIFVSTAVSSGWGGINPAPSDADYAWVNSLGARAASDAVAAGGINRAYKFTLPLTYSGVDAYLNVVVGGRGGDDVNGKVTFHYRRADASPSPVIWKAMPPKIEDTSGNKNANRDFAVTATSVAFNYYPPQSDTKGLLYPNTQTKITWDSLPETLTSGQAFTLAFKGAGLVVKPGQNDLTEFDSIGVSVKPSFSGLDQAENRVGAGWNGYTADPAKDTAFVSWHSGQMKTGGQPFWGVNQTFKLLPQKLSPPATITIKLTVSGGNGAGIDGGAVITFQWVKQ